MGWSWGSRKTRLPSLSLCCLPSLPFPKGLHSSASPGASLHPACPLDAMLCPCVLVSHWVLPSSLLGLKRPQQPLAAILGLPCPAVFSCHFYTWSSQRAKGTSPHPLPAYSCLFLPFCHPRPGGGSTHQAQHLHSPSRLMFPPHMILSARSPTQRCTHVIYTPGHSCVPGTCRGPGVGQVQPACWGASGPQERAGWPFGTLNVETLRQEGEGRA